MGISSKKRTTSATEQSTSNQNFTTTRTNPAWVEDAIRGFTGGVTDLARQDPSTFVAGPNALQTGAGEAAGALGGWRDGLDRATAMAGEAAGGVTPRAEASSLLTNLDDYLSPYLEQVVDTTAADFDANAGRTRAAQAASAARNNAFGGSRYAVREALTEGELARGRASTLAGLRDQGFTRAADLSDRDAGRRQQIALANQSASMSDLDRRLNASGLMGTLSNLEAGNARSDIDTRMGVGEALRGIETEQRQAPIGLMGAVSDLYGSIPFDLFSGQNTSGTTTSVGTSNSTTKESGGLLQQIGQAIQVAAAAAALSDLTVKRDVETIGHDDAGRRWVSWRYLWEDDAAPPHIGLIAQETLATDPTAVLEGADGLLRIDYSQVEAPQWLHS